MFGEVTDPLLTLCRTKIDDIDEQLLCLLHKRLLVVQEVGCIKRANKLNPTSFYCPDREINALNQLIKKNKHIIHKKVLIDLFKSIFSFSLSVQVDIEIVYLLDTANRTKAMGIQEFGRHVKIKAAESFPKLMQQLKTKSVATYGIISSEQLLKHRLEDKTNDSIFSYQVIHVLKDTTPKKVKLDQDLNPNNSIVKPYFFIIKSAQIDHKKAYNRKVLSLQFDMNAKTVSGLLKWFYAQNINVCYIDHLVCPSLSLVELLVLFSNPNRLDDIDCLLRQLSKQGCIVSILGSCPQAIDDE